jgi:hypothetical protein
MNNRIGLKASRKALRSYQRRAPMKSRRWWFSSNRMAFYVCSDHRDIITNTAPIGRKFIGQHIRNLADWLRRQGGFKYSELFD